MAVVAAELVLRWRAAYPAQEERIRGDRIRGQAFAMVSGTAGSRARELAGARARNRLRTMAEASWSPPKSSAEAILRGSVDVGNQRPLVSARRRGFAPRRPRPLSYGRERGGQRC